jgi:hypothetical protein
MLREAENYRLLHIFGFQKGGKIVAILDHRKLTRRVVGAQGIASLNVLVNL